MPKAFGHFALLATAFFGTWYLLSNIDLVGSFHLDQLSVDTEHNLGEIVLSEVRRGHHELESDSVRSFVNGIKKRLCTASGIADSSINLHIVIRDDVNAFALPDRHLVVFTGLMDYCHSPEEFAGVLAHEIAHIERGHVKKKLMKEVGLAMLTTIAGGEAGREIGQQTVRVLSSTAFDREQESEADASAVRMMAKAYIASVPLANLLFRLSQEKNKLPGAFDWLSTHPNSQDRAAEILKLGKMEPDSSKSLSDSASWATIRRIVREAKRSEP